MIVSHRWLLLAVLAGWLACLVQAMYPPPPPPLYPHRSDSTGYPTIPTIADALHQANLRNDGDTIVRLLMQSPQLKDTPCPTERRRTPLHYATVNGNAMVVRFLLSWDADVRLIDATGRSALELAAIHGQRDIFKMLFDEEKRGVASSRVHRAFSALVAVSGHPTRGQLEVVDLCLRSYEAEFVEELLDGHVQLPYYDLWAMTYWYRHYFSGQEPTWASHLPDECRYEERWPQMVPQPKASDGLADGGTPFDPIVYSSRMHWAAHYGSPVVLAMLWDHGADVDQRNRHGSTPVHLAAQYNRLQNLEFLKNAGANLQIRDIWGRTPLHLAVNGRHVEAAAFLVGEGVALDMRDQYQNTALFVAVHRKSLPLVKLLLEAGAGLRALDAHGRTVLQVAMLDRENLEIVALLARHAFFREAHRRPGKGGPSSAPPPSTPKQQSPPFPPSSFGPTSPTGSSASESTPVVSIADDFPTFYHGQLRSLMTDYFKWGPAAMRQKVSTGPRSMSSHDLDAWFKMFRIVFHPDKYPDQQHNAETITKQVQAGLERFKDISVLEREHLFTRARAEVLPMQVPLPRTDSFASVFTNNASGTPPPSTSASQQQQQQQQEKEQQEQQQDEEALELEQRVHDFVDRWLSGEPF